MKFTGEICVPAGREAVFDKLNDARFFASCVDGVSDLMEIDATHYTARLQSRIAYIRFTFDIAVEITESSRPDRVTAKAEGTPIGIVGRLTATSSAQLQEDAEGTRVAYDIDLSLAGKLGSIGQPALKSKAKEMERQFAARLLAAFARTEDAA